MDKYPPRSKLTRFEVIEDGDKIQLQFVHEDRPETFATLEYSLLGETIAFLTSALGQSIGIRAQAGKELNNENGKVPAQPIPAEQVQMHIADDKSHIVLEFQTPHGLSFQFPMAVKQAEGIARKILDDLETYPSPKMKH